MRNEVVVRTMSKVACTIQRWRFIFTLLHERGIYPSGRASLIDLRRTEHVVGERCRKLKFFLRFHQDPSMSSSSNESRERVCIYIPLVDRVRKLAR